MGRREGRRSRKEGRERDQIKGKEEGKSGRGVEGSRE